MHWSQTESSKWSLDFLSPHLGDPFKDLALQGTASTLDPPAGWVGVLIIFILKKRGWSTSDSLFYTLTDGRSSLLRLLLPPPATALAAGAAPTSAVS